MTGLEKFCKFIGNLIIIVAVSIAVYLIFGMALRNVSGWPLLVCGTISHVLTVLVIALILTVADNQLTEARSRKDSYKTERDKMYEELKDMRAVIDTLVVEHGFKIYLEGIRENLSTACKKAIEARKDFQTSPRTFESKDSPEYIDKTFKEATINHERAVNGAQGALARFERDAEKIGLKKEDSKGCHVDCR